MLNMLPKLAEGNFFLATVSKYCRFDSYHSQQLLDRIGGPSFLPESEKAAGNDNCDNNESIGGVTQEERQSRCEDKDKNNGTFELSK